MRTAHADSGHICAPHEIDRQARVFQLNRSVMNSQTHHAACLSRTRAVHCRDRWPGSRMDVASQADVRHNPRKAHSVGRQYAKRTGWPWAIVPNETNRQPQSFQLNCNVMNSQTHHAAFSLTHTHLIVSTDGLEVPWILDGLGPLPPRSMPIVMNASAVFPFGPIGIREGNAFPRFLKRAHSMHQTAHRGCKMRR